MKKKYKKKIMVADKTYQTKHKQDGLDYDLVIEKLNRAVRDYDEFVTVQGQVQQGEDEKKTR